MLAGAGGAEEPAGQSVTYAPQLVTVTSVVTSTVDVPQLPSEYPAGSPQPEPGAASTEVKRAAATIWYFIFADLIDCRGLDWSWFWGCEVRCDDEELLC